MDVQKERTALRQSCTVNSPLPIFLSWQAHESYEIPYRRCNGSILEEPQQRLLPLLCGKNRGAQAAPQKHFPYHNAVKISLLQLFRLAFCVSVSQYEAAIYSTNFIDKKTLCIGSFSYLCPRMAASYCKAATSRSLFHPQPSPLVQTNHKGRHECQQMPHTVCVHRLQCAVVNIFMLTATTTPTTTNSFIFNVLQNGPSWLLIRAVLMAETGHIAAQNIPFHGTIWHLLKIRTAEGAF